MSFEMCVSKGSALLSGAGAHIAQKRTLLKSTSNSENKIRRFTNTTKGHTLRKIKERNILPQRYGVKGTKAPAHHLCGVLLCVSSTPFFSLSLSLFTFLSRKREENTTNEDFRESDGQKQNERHARWRKYGKEEYKIDFPERNKNIKKWSWGSETELYL